MSSKQGPVKRIGGDQQKLHPTTQMGQNQIDASVMPGRRSMARRAQRNFTVCSILLTDQWHSSCKTPLLGQMAASDSLYMRCSLGRSSLLVAATFVPAINNDQILEAPSTRCLSVGIRVVTGELYFAYVFKCPAVVLGEICSPVNSVSYHFHMFKFLDGFRFR